SIGENADSLLDLEVMQTLREGDTDQLRTVGYASQRWVESQWKANFGKYFQNISAQFVAALESEFEMVEDLQTWKQEIERDARWMDSKVNELIPEFGPILTWSHAIANGTEGFSYNWTRSLLWENAQPLSVASHAGQNPLMIIAFKQQNSSVVEDMCDYAFEHGLNHLKRFIEVAEEEDAERETALQVVDQAWPLAREGYEVLRDKIGPALESNQSLISVASDWTLGGLPNMPAAPSSLPVPEIGIACSVDDRELFLEGCQELYGIFDKAVGVVREFEPDVVPADYQVPRPSENENDGVTSYTYEQWTNSVPLPGWEPRLVLGNDFLVAGYSQRQVADMSRKQEL
ncbi:MAG: hypothetical protein NXI32_31500, partial [bacterium]|nr:hypothetical protein [bacterium]